MNILFYLDGECCPSIGGIERITDILANGFSHRYNHKVFCLFKKKVDNDVRRTDFFKTYNIKNVTSSSIAEIIKSNDIDVIINQENHWDSKLLFDAVKLSGCKCHVVYALHSAPLTHAYEFVKIKHIFKEFLDGNRKALLKIFFYPVYKFFNLKKIKCHYTEAEIYSDRIVLLSDGFIKDWQNITCAKKSCDNKITVIPNISSFDTFASDQAILTKRHKVLYVGRLCEPVKRVSIILDIWRTIEADNRFNDWSLEIVGDGPDKLQYVNFVADNGLKRISFRGQQDPEQYYRDSSIFLLASAFEGWGMTLTEASQFGCVPVAFNTFASLSDIIKNGESGFIIEEGNLSDYEHKVKALMSSVELRRQMSHNAVELSRRYDKTIILDKWNKLFEEVNL